MTLNAPIGILHALGTGPAVLPASVASGRGWIRSGQTTGSVEAAITSQTVSIAPIEMGAIMEQQRRREQQAKVEAERRTMQRDYLARLRSLVGDRLIGGGDGEAAGVYRATASGGRDGR
jgi:hypothetical protein